jgi:hypothetical protein
MLASARAFFEGIIDYAGLFPPAELSLPQAMANYLRYRQEPDGWMLGRFICPAGRLKELAAFREETTRSGPLRLALLGRGGKDQTEFAQNLALDLNDSVSFAELGKGIAQAETFEVKLPHVLPLNTDRDGYRQGQTVGSMLAVSRLWKKHALAATFFECPWTEPMSVAEFAEALRFGSGRHVGWKLRCGGLTASAFPTPQQVARVLIECCTSGNPFKATAGLHHPLRHFDEKLKTPMHGFVNVFGAAILLHAREIEPGEVEAMLTDEDAGHFAFDDAGFSWLNHRASTAAIRQARQEVVTSFGSCSFEEPRDDLRRLGWI